MPIILDEKSGKVERVKLVEIWQKTQWSFTILQRKLKASLSQTMFPDSNEANNVWTCQRSY
jgi:hypothetical protein